jgi:hypothetical protein
MSFKNPDKLKKKKLPMKQGPSKPTGTAKSPPGGQIEEKKKP